jgi:hypothetical protein
MFDYVNYTLIPYLVKKHNKGLSDDEKITQYNFLLGLNFLRRSRGKVPLEGLANTRYRIISLRKTEKLRRRWT